MRHYFDAVLHPSTGAALEGVLVRIFDENDALVDIYADKNSTPIETVSGEANAAKTDADGMFSLYVGEGAYTVRFYQGDTVLKTITNVDLGIDVTRIELADTTGAALVGTSDGATVQGKFDALSASTGADLVGTSGGSTVQTNLDTLAIAAPAVLDTSGGADISAALAAKIAAAGGKAIVIPAGTWTAMNVDVTGATLEFAEGATISATLGASDNIFTTDGGTTLIRPVFEVTNTATPADGEIGNIITMGSYANTGEEYNGLEIVDGTFTSLNTVHFGLAISCLGRCQRIRLRGVTRMVGRFSGGFQAHWGGEFVGDPHTSEVTASYHPNDIQIDTLVLEKGGPSTLGGHLGLSLSAAYNVNVGTIINKGWDRTDWIQPGDVYDLVATEDQADKIMSGIRIGYTEIVNPVAITGSYNNVLVSGVSATIRTAGQTEVVCAADRQNMRVDHGEIRVICEAGHVYNTIPLVRMTYAKNSRAKVSVKGVAALDATSTSLIQALYNTDCEIIASSTDAARLLSGFGNVRGRYTLDWRNPNLPTLMPTTHKAVSLGGVGGSATVGADAAIGATSVTISAWTSVTASMVVKGTRLYLSNGSFVTLSRSQTIGTGVTSIAVEPIPVAITTGTSLLVQCKEMDSVIGGTIEGAYTAIEMVNTDGVSVPAHITYSAKYDVLLDGAVNRRSLFNGVYDRCGQSGSGVLYNINLGGAGVLTENVSVIGAKFEPSGTPLVSANVYGRSTNNAHPGLKVTDSDLNSTSFSVNYLWPNDDTVAARGLPQVYNNRSAVGSGAPFDPAQGAAMRKSNAYHIIRATVSSLASIPASSSWEPTTFVVGQPKRQVKLPDGTWASEGNL